MMINFVLKFGKKLLTKNILKLAKLKTIAILFSLPLFGTVADNAVTARLVSVRSRLDLLMKVRQFLFSAKRAVPLGLNIDKHL